MRNSIKTGCISLLLIIVFMCVSDSVSAQFSRELEVEYLIGTISAIDIDTNTLTITSDEGGLPLECVFDPQSTTIWIGDEEGEFENITVNKIVEISYYEDESGARVIDTIDLYTEPLGLEEGEEEGESLFESISEDLIEEENERIDED